MDDELMYCDFCGCAMEYLNVCNFCGRHYCEYCGVVNDNICNECAYTVIDGSDF